MKISKRLNLALKVLTSQQLGNSVGSVLRNYSKESYFSPHEQLRGITYKAIDKIGMSVSNYVPEVHNARGDTYVNHPLIKLAMQPNERQHGSDFFHLWGMLFEIYGETFWYLARGERSRAVKELYLLNPAMVELNISGGELVGYTLHKQNGEQVPFLPDEIVHDKRPNPFNEWRGMSVMERAAIYIDTEITTSRFTLNYMKNNASPSGIISLPNMDRDTFKQFTAQWREGYEGPENAGKTAFIRNGEANFKAVGATLQDIDQKVTREMAKDDVLMMLDMPKGLLGMSGEKGMGRNELEPLEYVFAKYKLEPMLKRLDRIFTRISETMPVNQQAKEIVHVSVIPEDKEFVLKTHEKGVNIWLTVNEIRADQGLEPLSGGDELMRSNTVAQPQRVVSEAMRVSLKKKVEKQTKDLDTEREEFRSKVVGTSEKYATQLQRELSKFSGKQEAKVIDNINATAKSFEEWLPSVKEESEALTALLLPIMVALMEEEVKNVTNFITGELIAVTPELRRTVEQNILQIAGVYNADTITALETTLSQGQASGESLAKLKKRVESVYSDAKGYRAERIARTESLRAANRTAELVYKQNGYSSVEWFVNPGACEFCRTYVGRTKEIGGTFNKLGDVVTGTDGGQLSIGYSDIDAPPLHPNCTCSLVPGA